MEQRSRICAALLDHRTVFLAAGTSGVEPAASFAASVRSHARAIYVGPDRQPTLHLFSECHPRIAGAVIPELLEPSPGR
jgi:hypothetical protein